MIRRIRILVKLKKFSKIFRRKKKYIRLVGVELFPADGETDGHKKAINCFPKFCESCPIASLCMINVTEFGLALNTGLSGSRQTTNCLSWKSLY
jgi:hypothetical protein